MSSRTPTHRLHVACIMDGNGRWARRRGLPRTDGHTAGEEALAEVVRAASDRQVGWLTAFGFSTENWVRPRTEVRHILSLHRKLFSRTEEMNRNNARTRWIGRPFIEKGARTPVLVQKAITKAIADTSANTGLSVTIAFDYGSRSELVRASRQAMTKGVVTPTCTTPRCLLLTCWFALQEKLVFLISCCGKSKVLTFISQSVHGPISIDTSLMTL